MKTDTVRLALITCREGLEHFERLRREGGWSPQHFDFFVPHQASAATLSGVVREANKRLGATVLDDTNVVNNLALRGNTVTTTHFLAIHDAIRAGRIRSGHRLLLSTVASGVTIGSAIYVLDDLPERILSASEAAAPNVAAPQPAELAWTHELKGPVRIESLAVAEHGEQPDALALGKAAARSCLGRSALARNAIELLIFAGVYRSEFIVEPALAAFLAGELRINDSSADPARRTLAFDLNDSSNGFLSACHVAACAIVTGEVACALVVVAEGDLPHAAGSPAVAPAASAVLLQASADGRGFERFGFYTFPEEHHALRSDVVLRSQGGAELRRELHPALRSVYTRCVHRALERYLSDAGESSADLDYLVLPDVDPTFARAARDLFQLPAGVEVVTSEAELDRFTSALPHRLSAIHSGATARKRAVLVSAGAGVKVACATYQF